MNKKNVYTGKFLNVFKKSLVLPNLKNIDVEYIEHNGAVLIIPFLNENEIIMIKQYRPTIEDYIYEFPAGTIEEREDILDCAKREIIEETGYESKNWQDLGFIYPCPGYSNEKIYIFKASELIENTSLKQDEEELIFVEIFSKERIYEYFKLGKITDSKTIASLLFLEIL